jgi:Protein of unknown function DUF72
MRSPVGHIVMRRTRRPLFPYEEAKKRAEPYNKIVAELPEMRREAVDLMKRSIDDGRRVYALVNNRSEGNAPLTVQALAEQVSAGE